MTITPEPPIKKREKNGGQFKPGNAGGPGRPNGARNSATVLLEQMMADDGEAIVKAVIVKAKGGDMQAARIVLDRIAPQRKGSVVKFDMPDINTAGEIGPAIAAVARAMADGEITPDEAQVITAVIETQRKAIETGEIEGRLAALEDMAR